MRGFAQRLWLDKPCYLIARIESDVLINKWTVLFDQIMSDFVHLLKTCRRFRQRLKSSPRSSLNGRLSVVTLTARKIRPLYPDKRYD